MEHDHNQLESDCRLHVGEYLFMKIFWNYFYFYMLMMRAVLLIRFSNCSGKQIYLINFVTSFYYLPV